jgi:hypothetical protein
LLRPNIQPREPPVFLSQGRIFTCDPRAVLKKFEDFGSHETESQPSLQKLRMPKTRHKRHGESD